MEKEGKKLDGIIVTHPVMIEISKQALQAIQEGKMIRMNLEGEGEEKKEILILLKEKED